MSYLFSEKQMKILSTAAGQNVSTEFFFWNESKLPKDFIDDTRGVSSDVTNLVFRKNAQFIKMSYTLKGVTVEKEYNFYVLDYKKYPLEKSIILTDKFFDLFMKKLGCKIMVYDGKKTTNQVITKIEKKENKTDTEDKIKKALEDAQKALEKEKDEDVKVILSTQIKRLNYFLKIREEQEQLIKALKEVFVQEVKETEEWENKTDEEKGTFKDVEWADM